MSARPLLRLPEGALARRHFHALSQAEQAAAIRRISADSQGDHTIARATGLSVEQVRRVLALQLSTQENSQ
jgi:hypothetical protein